MLCIKPCLSRSHQSIAKYILRSAAKCNIILPLVIAYDDPTQNCCSKFDQNEKRKGQCKLVTPESKAILTDKYSKMSFIFKIFSILKYSDN